jgi:hypothetical protein
MRMPSSKQSILLVGTPAILAIGGLSAIAASAPTPTSTPAQQTKAPAEPAETADAAEAAPGAAETAGTADTAAEANEPALLGGGHADGQGRTSTISSRASSRTSPPQADQAYSRPVPFRPGV